MTCFVLYTIPMSQFENPFHVNKFLSKTTSTDTIFLMHFHLGPIYPGSVLLTNLVLLVLPISAICCSLYFHYVNNRPTVYYKFYYTCVILVSLIASCVHMSNTWHFFPEGQWISRKVPWPTARTRNWDVHYQWPRFPSRRRRPAGWRKACAYDDKILLRDGPHLPESIRNCLGIPPRICPLSWLWGEVKVFCQRSG